METLCLYILSLFIALSYTTTLFFLALYKKDNSIIDIAYGIGFIITAYILTIIFYGVNTISIYSWIILALITIWGTRLAYRIHQKNKGKSEDFRYAAWRKEWQKKGKLYYVVRAYLQIFILQGIVISLLLLPFTLSLMTGKPIVWLLIIGLLTWCKGFFFEAMGDRQLDKFIKDKNKKSTIMKTGLWKYTRHPNYFGESMMWWGLAIISFSTTHLWLAFLSPIIITYLLLFVSGIPMLEKKWIGNPEWEEYREKTSAFIPLPPKAK